MASAGDYVEFSFGRIGRVIRETPKTSKRPEGYDILPCNTGTGDAWGMYSQNYPKSQCRDADMSVWCLHCPADAKPRVSFAHKRGGRFHA